MARNAQEQQLLNEAIAILQNTIDMQVKVLPLPQNERNPRPDAAIAIHRKGHTEHFLVEVKNIDRRIAIGQVKAQLEAFIKHHPGFHPLLVTRFLTAEMADECRKLDLQFIDTAGNIYLHTDFFIADIRGKERPENPLKDEYRANNPAGLKITFALLCKPELAGAQYRETAKFAQVALGTVGPVLKDLIERGYLQERKTRRILVRRKELLNEWVAHYPVNLRPTLHARRYQADRTRLTETDLGQYQAYWGGEYGAEKLTRYLKAERFTIYVTGTPPPAFMMNTRMRLAGDGNTEILQTFWPPDLTEHPANVAPPLLIYADLIATAEPRNLETAKEVYERFLEAAED